MKIKTKFDIGSTVYCITYPRDGLSFGEASLNSGAFIVTNISVGMSNEETRITYCVSPKMYRGLDNMWVSEDHAFSTFKESQEALPTILSKDNL